MVCFKIGTSVFVAFAIHLPRTTGVSGPKAAVGLVGYAWMNAGAGVDGTCGNGIGAQCGSVVGKGTVEADPSLMAYDLR